MNCFIEGIYSTVINRVFLESIKNGIEFYSISPYIQFLGQLYIAANTAVNQTKSRVGQGENQAKAQLELNLVVGVKETKQINKCTNSKRRAKEDFHPFLGAIGNVTTEDKAEVLRAFFTSVFESRIS